MYRAAVEGLLGISRHPEGLLLDPGLPEDWPGIRARLRRGDRTVEIEVRRVGGRIETTVNGDALPRGGIVAF